MKNLMANVALAAAVMTGAALMSDSASASTIYTNLSGGYNCCTGGTISGYGSLTHHYSDYSDNFTSLETASVSQIDIALGYLFGTNGATVSLWTAGFGTELGSWNLTNLPTIGFNPATPNGLTTISGISGVNVTAGDSYVLLVTPLSPTNDTWAGWNISTSNDQQGAFDALSTSATPLPSTWLMLLSGFLGLGYFAYRGTKKRTVVAA